jgi:hypothetical protein
MHEGEVQMYAQNNKVDKVNLGGLEFKITLDSFMMKEIDKEAFTKPCEVCADKIRCPLRF